MCFSLFSSTTSFSVFDREFGYVFLEIQCFSDRLIFITTNSLPYGCVWQEGKALNIGAEYQFIENKRDNKMVKSKQKKKKKILHVWALSLREERHNFCHIKAKLYK